MKNKTKEIKDKVAQALDIIIIESIKTKKLKKFTSEIAKKVSKKIQKIEKSEMKKAIKNAKKEAKKNAKHKAEVWKAETPKS